MVDTITSMSEIELTSESKTHVLYLYWLWLWQWMDGWCQFRYIFQFSLETH